MTRKGTRKKKRFRATSLPVLSPKTLQKGRSRTQQKRTRTHKKKESALKSLSRSWGFSHYIALMLIASSISALVFLFTDATFRTGAPQVEGNHYLDAQQILQQAHLDGVNIYLIDPAEASRKLVTFMPQIEKVSVRLGLPDRVLIQVVEREPVLTYSQGEHRLWADAEGFLFPMTTELDTLPKLLDEDGSASVDGSHLNPGVWQGIQEIAASISGIDTFYYRDIYGLFFISPEGWRVYLGDGDNMQHKLAMWQTIRQQLLQENRTIKAVDLRYDRVYIQ